MGMSNAERQRRWRENNPEAANQAASDSRARKAGMARRPVQVVVELTPGEAALVKEHWTAHYSEYPDHATLEDVARAELLSHAMWNAALPPELKDVKDVGKEAAAAATDHPWVKVLWQSCHAQCDCPAPDSMTDAQREETPCLWRECAATGKAARNVAGHDLSKQIRPLTN